MWQLWCDHVTQGVLNLFDSSVGDFEVNGMHQELPPDFLTVDLQAVATPDGTFMQRIMNALGSKTNWVVMSLLNEDMNGRKGEVSFRTIQSQSIFAVLPIDLPGSVKYVC